MALNEACAKLEKAVNAYVFRKSDETDLEFREELVGFINRNYPCTALQRMDGAYSPINQK